MQFLPFNLNLTTKPGIIRRYLLGAGAAILLASIPLPTTAHTEKSPTAEEILDGFIAATGGKAAYAKITTSVATGTLEIAAQNLKGNITIKFKAPDKFYLAQELGGKKFETGFDGKIGWSKDPVFGLRTLSGKELDQMKDSSSFNEAVTWKTKYSKTEVLGIRKVNGASTYAVRLTNRQGTTTTQYYDVKTKLLVRSDVIAQSPQGPIPTETYTSDYRLQDGVKVPFATRQLAAGIEAIMKLDTIKNNVPISDSDFAKPEESAPADTKK